MSLLGPAQVFSLLWCTCLYAVLPRARAQPIHSQSAAGLIHKVAQACSWYSTASTYSQMPTARGVLQSLDERGALAQCGGKLLYAGGIVVLLFFGGARRILGPEMGLGLTWGLRAGVVVGQAFVSPLFHGTTNPFKCCSN